MASVYVGRLPGLAGFERLVAIKVIHPYLSQEREFVDMFLDEARLAARIHHPNVGEIFEVDEDDGLFYMVMELVQGHSLQSFMKRARALGLAVSQPIAAFIASKICHGLQAAHDLRGPDGEPIRLVHRDVSPRNILLSYEGFVKLIDFGVAWAKDRVSHTESGLLKGKVGYMAPEQIRGQNLDARSDVFSLGVVMYLMVTGSHPFPGATDAERMHKILNSKFISPRKANPGLYPAMERILLKAMSGNPHDRFESASHMAQELKKFIRQTSEDLGAQELSVLMHSLFSSEKEEHDGKIRSFHKDAEERSVRTASMPARLSWQSEPSASGAVQPSLIEETAQEHPKALPNELEQDLDTIQTEEMLALVGRKRRPRLVLASLLCLVAVAMVLWLAVYPKEERSAPAAKPAAVVLEKAAGSLLDGDDRASRPAISISEPAALLSKPRFVSIGLSLAPESAQVSLDGEPVDVRDGRLLLPLSEEIRKLVISAPGHATQEKEIVADQDRQLEIRLERVLRPSHVRGGTVKSEATTQKEPQKTLELRGSPY
jgi:serine/threonine-protein kinase